MLFFDDDALTTAPPSNASNITTAAPPGPSAEVISQELLPALLSIFVVILGGYLAGTFKLLDPSAVRGLAKTCGMIQLPILLFCGLATIDFYSPTFADLKVFMYGICIAKSIVFALIVVMCVLTDRSVDRWGKAGIRGVFVTQQNDFSLGLPIFAALYLKTKPQFMSILFLAAPVSLVLLNPLAFVMMEYSNTQKQGQKMSCRVMLKILLKVVTNPITWSAFLGLIVNFCTKGTLPPILYAAPNGGLLGGINAAFPFLSNFGLGLIIVGKLRSMKPRYVILLFHS
jgi:predicted permease